MDRSSLCRLMFSTGKVSGLLQSIGLSAPSDLGFVAPAARIRLTVAEPEAERLLSFAEGLGDLVRSRGRERTTFGSRKLIEYAAEGRFAASLSTLVDALLAGEDDGLDTAARRWLGRGAQSGLHSALGVCEALSLVCPRRRSFGGRGSR